MPGPMILADCQVSRLFGELYRYAVVKRIIVTCENDRPSRDEESQPIQDRLGRQP